MSIVLNIIVGVFVNGEMLFIIFFLILFVIVFV